MNYMTKDPLTGLYLQEAFLKLLETERFGCAGTYGILSMEFDELARFNETIGYDIDDELLLQIKERILQLIPSNPIARTGTFSYAIAMCGKEGKLGTMAETIISILHEPFSVGENMFYVTASIGISEISTQGASTLLKQAESAMRHAQKSGSNHIGNYCDENVYDIERELKLLKELPLAIDNEEIHFLYQPQYSYEKNTFVGAELLARWHHEEYGEISPVDFIPMAEKSGMIVPITTKLLIEASKMFDTLEASEINHFSLSVNISPRVLMEKSFLDTVKFLMEFYNLEGKNLTFEIMEDMLTDDLDTLRRLLEKIRDMGIEIAIDDYGTGHTSLKYLTELPIDYLKIDRSFVSSIYSDTKTFTLFKSITDMADALNLKVVAEGVEDETEDEVLSCFSGMVVQGFYYSKPLKREEFLTIVTSPQ